MSVANIVNRYTLTKHWSLRVLLPTLAISLVLCALFVVFTVVPGEAVMGAVQRIFYFHVASALAAYVMIGILFVGSVCYLVLRDEEWDLLATAACSIAFLFSSIVLATGMIWGHSAWNTWWRWEPRLVSFLVLWLILLSYLVLRAQTGSGSQQRNLCAVLGIVSAVNVPIVVFSIKLLAHAEQLHPQVVAREGLTEKLYLIGLILSVVAVTLSAFWLLLVRLTNEVLKRDAAKVSIDLVIRRGRSYVGG